MSRVNLWIPLFLWICLPARAQVSILLSPEVSQESFTLPVRFEFQHSSGIRLVHQSRGYHLDHAHEQYLWQRKSRNDLTLISEVSHFGFEKDGFTIGVGRNYLRSGPGKFAGLFLSPTAPSTDHVHIRLEFLSKLKYDYFIIRLDDRNAVIDGSRATVQRWYYLRRLSIKIFEGFELGLKDAVVATGRDRGVDLNFLNPFAIFGLEQLHENNRTEGLSSGPAGMGNNENQFMGFDWAFQIENLTIYNEWLIDEFQIDSEDRAHFQDVFGTLLGVQLSPGSWQAVIEYAYASPWLYLNRGLFTAPERHELPLGLRSPHYQSLDLGVKVQIDSRRSFQGQIHYEQRGAQTISTPWDNFDNKIGYFDFQDTLPLEVKILYSDSEGKFFHHIGLYRSWLGSGKLQFVVGWDLDVR